MSEQSQTLVFDGDFIQSVPGVDDFDQPYLGLVPRAWARGDAVLDAAEMRNALEQIASGDCANPESLAKGVIERLDRGRVRQDAAPGDQTALQKAAMALYAPPFRYDQGWILDSGDKLVADQDTVGSLSGLIAARIRGWGRLKYIQGEHSPEELQDAAGEHVARALTEYWGRHSGSKTRALEAWQIYLLRLAAIEDFARDLDWSEKLEFFINCNDVFYWGVADAEGIESEEDVEDLRRACADADLDGPLLYCARRRGIRPQGAAYKILCKKNWPLFDSCGPERAPELGNPEARPED